MTNADKIFRSIMEGKREQVEALLSSMDWDAIDKMYREKPENKKYKIDISYSWGESEEPVGSYETKEDAFKNALRYAAMEAYVQNEEFEPYSNATIHADFAEYKVTLRYHSDEECCFYTVIEADEYEEEMSYD